MHTRTALAALVASGALAATTGCGGAIDDRPTLAGTYEVTRTLTLDDPCPDFDFADTLELVIDEPVITIDGTAATVTSDVDGRSYELTGTESWHSSDGDADPTIGYVINAGSDALAFTGTATTSFDFDTQSTGTTCSYTWSLQGQRASQ